MHNEQQYSLILSSTYNLNNRLEDLINQSNKLFSMFLNMPNHDLYKIQLSINAFNTAMQEAKRKINAAIAANVPRRRIDKMLQAANTAIEHFEHRMILEIGNPVTYPSEFTNFFSMHTAFKNAMLEVKKNLPEQPTVQNPLTPEQKRLMVIPKLKTEFEHALAYLQAKVQLKKVADTTPDQ